MTEANEREDDNRPNVLVVLTDQQRWDTVGAYGSAMDLTPNLDAMAERGTKLERAFTTQPLCGPSRSCLQTGQYATTNGVWKNGRSLPDTERLLAKEFTRNGYRTHYVGKWHLADTGTDPVPAEHRAGYEDGWLAADVPEFTSHPTEGVLYDEENSPVEFEDEYRVDAYTDLAISVLEAASESDDPFFCFLSYLEPHHQNDMETFVAPEGYAERYAQDPYVPPDLRDRPGDWYAELPDYYGICRRIDECLGRILDTLEREGIAEDTIVLFTSDHGCHFRTRPGEYKRSAHEASIRVPAVLRGPGFDGGTVSELVSLLNVPPTLLDAAGLDVPERMEGRSIVPLVEDENIDWREEVFVQISESEIGRALRTERWKYAVAAPTLDGWKEGMDEPASDSYVERYLYDLAADPAERVNLVGRPEYRNVAEGLRERLLAHIEQIEDERPEISPYRNPGYREY